MYAQLCSSRNEIFTSVVVYSRTTIPYKPHNTIWVIILLELMCCVCVDLLLFFEKWRQKRRKKRSTHACMHNCAVQRTKYSRRLLSILAQISSKQKQTKKWCWIVLALTFLFAETPCYFCKEEKKKKNGAHTNSRTTVQLDERNIHVGCCLFSHKKSRNTKKKTKCDIGCFQSHIVLIGVSIDVFSRVKKNGALMCVLHNCAARESQYSRRLLSILAQIK